MRPWRRKVLVVAGWLLVIVALASAPLWWREPAGPGETNAQICSRNLLTLALHLEAARSEGWRKLLPLEGAAFLLQLADALSNEELDTFCCPLDADAPRPNPRGALHCSYYGPDRETVEATLDGSGTGSFILACCDRHLENGCSSRGPEDTR